MAAQKHYSTICYDALAACISSTTNLSFSLIPSHHLSDEEIFFFVDPLYYAQSFEDVKVHLRNDSTQYLNVTFGAASAHCFSSLSTSTSYQIEDKDLPLSFYNSTLTDPDTATDNTAPDPGCSMEDRDHDTILKLVPCPRPDPADDAPDDVKVVKYLHTSDKNEG